jgi:hypothetical protein
LRPRHFTQRVLPSVTADNTTYLTGENVMRIKLPVHRRAGHRPRRARLVAILAGLAVPALLGGTLLAGPASASTGFTTHITPNNTLGLLLDVSGGSTQPGAGVIDYWANGGANQQWTFRTTGAYDTYEIINVNSGMCLAADYRAGDQVFQNYCDGSPTQQWVTGLNPGSIYAYTIQNVGSQLYLDVNGDSPWPGAMIDTWPYTGGQNQYFSAI